MASKNKNMISEYMDKFQEWWKTDTAKAVATIVAVLLIPASVLAWNYYTSNDKAVTEENSATITDENFTETVPSEDAVTPNEDPDPTIKDTAVGGIGVSELPNTSSKE